MATKARERSESGFYHVYQRGVCLFDIFEDDGDHEFYLERLGKYCKDYGVELHAWCLMSNHTHLLVKADLEDLSAMMRGLGSSYARFFNARHARTGPLFEGRFGSVCVETDAQYMNVIRYIHRNPIKHEESTLCGSYPWSSYAEHAAAAPVTCVVDFALALFGDIDAFVRFHSDRDGDKQRHLDIGTSGPMKDDEARWRADESLLNAGFDVPISLIGTLPRKLRDQAIAVVKKTIGCSLRQLQRLTAIAYSAIRNAVKLACGEVEDEPEEPEAPILKELIGSWGKPDSADPNNLEGVTAPPQRRIIPTPV